MNRCSKFLLAAVVAATSSSLFAESATWQWKANGSGGWADSTRWTKLSGETDATYPQVEDVVEIPSGTTAYVYDADMAIAGMVTGIVFKASSSKIVFDLQGDHETAATIHRTTSPSDTTTADGTIVKTGPGSLWLKRNNHLYSYFENIIVSNGILRLPCVSPACRNQNFRKITVVKPGVLQPVTWNGEGTSNTMGCTWYTMLYGDGIITNPTPDQIDLYCKNSSYASRGTFSGTFCGSIRFINDANSWYQDFTGTGSTCAGQVRLSANSIIGIADFGGTTDTTGGNGSNKGSTGTGTFVFRNNSTDTAYFHYLGTGGASYAQFYLEAGAALMNLDAGSTGGLDLKGKIDVSKNTVGRIRLAGTGLAENKLEGTISIKSGGTAYVTKDGPCAWNFTGQNRTFNGAIEVKDGMLRFDSIDFAGQKSALGLGNLLKANANVAAIDEATDVDYAYLLGDGTHTGTMEYTGAEDAITDRRFAVNGSGRISSTGGALKILKAAGKSPAANTLALGGSAEDCELVDLDGESVKLVKEGVGDWTVSGNVDSLDGVEVKEGLLDLGKVAENYTWFRLTVMDKYSRVSNLTDNGYVDLGRLGLFNATGGVVNASCLTNLTKNGRHLLLNPGEYCLGFPEGSANDASYLYNTDSYRLCYFEPTENGGSSTGFFRVRYKKNGKDQTKWPSLNDPDSWLTITLRLPEGAEKVTSYDLSSRWDYTDSSSGNGANAIDAWKLEGSLDGVHWTLLHQMDDYHAKPEYKRSEAPNRWMIGSGKANNIAGSLCHTDGVAIADPVRPTRYANGVGPVKVDAGATLQTGDPIALDELELDITNATAGTLKGFTFASTGTLHLTGTGRLPQLLEVAIDLGDASATAVSGWSVTYNDNPIAHRTVSYDAAAKKLTVIGPGLQLYFR